MRPLLLLAALTGGCTGTGDTDTDPVDTGPFAPCQAPGEPGLELAHLDADYGAFQPGDAIFYGTPPQGGAPYSPWRVKVSGLEGLDTFTTIDLRVVDPADGAELGTATYYLDLVCANVGDDAGSYVSSELHVRFLDWSLEALAEREAELTVTVTTATDDLAVTIVGWLTLM